MRMHKVHRNSLRQADNNCCCGFLQGGHLQGYKTTWGLHCPGTARGKLLAKLADIMEAHTEELAALEALDVGAYKRNEWLTLSSISFMIQAKLI